MRLHRLEICGFGPFRDRQTVDFDAFADDGIFLIAGRTGAGKSSILDAVCFGLYGSVPRYDSGEKRLRSDHCEPDDPSEVVVEFSTSAGRFRVTRSPEYLRPAKRGGGMTKQPSSVALDEWTGDGWIGRAARAVDVAAELDEILQLSQGQFLQVILLAQNRFARFLLADSKERQALLRRLFGTERFEDIQARFDDRRRASENALGARLAMVAARLDEAETLVTAEQLAAADEPDADGADVGESAAHDASTTSERLEALRRAQARAEYRSERAAAARDDAERGSTAADAALADLREQQKAQQERDRARTALARLDDERPQIAQAQLELDRARRAESLRAPITAAHRAEQALAEAAEAERAAHAVWDALGIDLPEISVPAIEQWAADRTRQSGVWEQAVQLEQQAEAREADLVAAQERVTAANAEIEADHADRTALPAQRAELVDAHDTARRLADRAEHLAQETRRAQERRNAAMEVDRLAAALQTEERAYAESNVALAAAQTGLSQLLQRRLDGMAGELASALEEGAPCAVCGSTTHPAPAVHTDPVSADDVALAQRERDAAAIAEREAGERVAAAQVERAAAEARADGRTPEQAESELAAASAAQQEATDAVVRVTALDAQLREIDERAERLERRRDEAAATLAAAREALAVVEERAREAEALIAQARGAYASVAERSAEAKTQIAAAGAFAVALGELDRRRIALTEAVAERDAAINASDFDAASAIEDALRSVAECDALDARIRAHAVASETEKAVLLPLELRALPEEPIELAAAEQAATEARTAWTSAVDAAGRAATTADRLSGLIDDAAAEHARSAAQAEEHETLRGLADTIAGRAGNTHRMTLETFVLAAELEEIVTAANRRLSDMSTGRYQLRHSDALAARGAASGLGIVVFDAFTGQTRPAQSLSGGETFLSSLALALGLAEVVTARAGGIALDTLFIDEGFGSLDADTLDIAMRTLDELRAGGRTVGVISHVEAMQEQIPAQVRVEQTDAGSSRIRT